MQTGFHRLAFNSSKAPPHGGEVALHHLPKLAPVVSFALHQPLLLHLVEDGFFPDKPRGFGKITREAKSDLENRICVVHVMPIVMIAFLHA